MTPSIDRSPAELVLTGEIIVSAGSRGLETAESIAIGAGRVLAVGRRAEVLGTSRGAREVLAEGVIVPGVHDFHLHLVGMARARHEVVLDALTTRDEVTAALLAAAAEGPRTDSWIRGRGWREGLLDIDRLNADRRLQERPALIYSHDAHSAWASPAALRLMGLGEGDEPIGGRIERSRSGHPTGLLRERACDAVEARAGRVDGEELAAALRETLAELAGMGVTGATDAGDSSAENGIGRAAALGDRASRLWARASLLDGRLRLSVNVPVSAIEAAAGLGMRTGRPLSGTRTLRGGWAKAYADGALGSRTAALFEPYTCGGGRGMLTMGEADLDDRLRASTRHEIRLAVHAIGDRATAGVLDAFERAGSRHGPGADRVEHLQLVRPADRARMARLGLVASVQPVHAAADRRAVEECWADRVELAYAWRAMADAGAALAFGSDAPIESANPWLGIFCAVHRRFPHEPPPDWRPAAAVTVPEALTAYTLQPALAIGADDEGHLGVGARADLAMLNVDLATLTAADERLADVRSLLTLVDGAEVHRA